MTRRCSHCSNNGHNSRTCPTRGGGGGGGSAVKLFGVRLTDGSIIKKSASMGNLPALAAAAARLHHSPSSSNGSHNHDSLFSDHAPDPNHAPDGYLSDDPAHCSEFSHRPGDKKKGVPWTEEEHRLFLTGLGKLGKGDWRGIARNYVVSRTPTQVASHAQKYFLHRSNSTRRKRRSSLFDMVPDDITISNSLQMSFPNKVTDKSMVQEVLNLLPSSKLKESDDTNCPISLDLSLKTLESEPTPVSAFEPIKEHEEERIENATAISPTFIPSCFPAPYTYWHPTATASPLGDHQQAPENHTQHLVIEPTPVPVFAGNPVNVEELVGISQLSIGEVKNSHREPSPLSLKLIGQSSKPSPFHGNSSDLSKDHKVIHAV